MSVALLDANVLIALMWPAHEDHDRAQEWFSRNAHHGWATCPFTQAAFVRIISNPAFSPDAVTPFEATKLLATNLGNPHHHFWLDEIAFERATEKFLKILTGHNQVTDAYLLGLAIHKKGQLVTMDRGMIPLLGSGATETNSISVI